MTHTATLAIYVPQDSLAIALGADDMAASIQQWAKHQSVPVQIIRNGSRGLFWLEPLIEIEIRQTKQPSHSHNLVGANSLKKRIAYGPMCLAELKRLLQIPNWYLGLKTHALFLGPIEKHPYLANQERLSFSRIGLFEPTNLKAYQQHHGLAGLEQALALSPQQVIEKITESGLRGRGGAAFPTGIKWQTVANAPKKQKYIICNADEGDAGGFSDRLIMEADPFSLIEGMLIAAWAVGANKGVIYLRSEYPNSELILTKAIQLAYQNNLLGKNILGNRFHFDLSLFKGAGSYICGEETALLESMEGKTGLVRAKPPLPAHRGYLGCPTVVNNVVTLATVPTILARGAAYYANYGMGRSRGTLAFQLSGNVKQGGLVEKAFGLSLRELIEEFGQGTHSGRPIKAIQVGGPLGAYIPKSLWDTPLDYEAFQNIGGLIGHGGVIIFDDQINIPSLAQHAMDFCAFESCGKCTPCRIGSVRAGEIIANLGHHPEHFAQQKEQLLELCDTMEHASLCALGGMAPYPVRSLIKLFEKDFYPPQQETPHA